MAEKIRSRSEICSEFNAVIKRMITSIEKKSRNEIEISNLDRLTKRLSLLKQVEGEEASLVLATPFFMEFQETIVTRNEKALMDMDFRAEIKKRNIKVSKQDEFGFELSDSIREHYRRSSSSDKDTMYSDLKKLFECCIEYQLAQ